MGTTPMVQYVSSIPVLHLASHWGEIAALKGVQGLKGLPF